MKQAILIRTDLKMGKGKIAAQCAHASIGAYLKTKKYSKDRWKREGMKKVVLKISGEKEIKKFYKLAKKRKLPCSLIRDAGLTQIEGGTITALGIGPGNDKKIDKLTGKLKLL
ncbi:MAG: peptidyl-tRNA hydrolase [Candidatus Aenigmarchaeota archaeon]|nr:peptidyl-tRNA hydrolase [Candidatus Aenigmarchaeota archaeon]